MKNFYTSLFASLLAALAPAAWAQDPASANPYGLGALINHGDWVTWLVLAVLVVMSLSSWYVIIAKAIEQSRVYRHAKAIESGFWDGATVRASADQLAPESAFRYITERGLAGTQPQSGLLGGLDLETWVCQNIERAIANVQRELQDGLAVLATVGSVAPFVGLFGTVWGILNALVSIGVSGQASIDKVAGPVGEALYMTAIGLAVAVPAVLGYNWLVRRNKSAMDVVTAFGNDLQSVLLLPGAH